MSTTANNLLYGTTSGALGDARTYITNQESEVVAPQTLAAAIELADGSDLEASLNGMVKGIPQELTDEQRGYARENIRAVSYEANAGYTNTEQQNARTNIGAVHIGGDTMTGPLTLSGTPSEPFHAATKEYVDKYTASQGGGDMYAQTYDPNGEQRDIFAAISAVDSLITDENTGVNKKIADLEDKIETLEAQIAAFQQTLESYVTLGAYTAQVATLTEQIQAANTTFNSHTARTDNPHKVTKAQVGLSLALNRKIDMTLSGSTLSTYYTKPDDES